MDRGIIRPAAAGVHRGNEALGHLKWGNLARCGHESEVVWKTMLWYYVSDRQERLAVPEDQLGALAGTGVLRPSTLVWRKGMEQWASAGELKPELFSGEPAMVPSAAGPAGSLESTGMVTDLARALRPYAGWVEVSGWLHGLTGVAAVASGTAISYFAWLKPARLTEWTSRMPPAQRPLLEHPWWTVGALGLLALLLLFMGAQLVGGAARVRRAEALGSREELRIALRSMGSFFRATVLSLFAGLLLLTAGLLHHFRPWQKSPATPPAAAPSATAKERVTI